MVRQPRRGLLRGGARGQEDAGRRPRGAGGADEEADAERVGGEGAEGAGVAPRAAAGAGLMRCRGAPAAPGSPPGPEPVPGPEPEPTSDPYQAWRGLSLAKDW